MFALVCFDQNHYLMCSFFFDCLLLQPEFIDIIKAAEVKKSA